MTVLTTVIMAGEENEGRVMEGWGRKRKIPLCLRPCTSPLVGQFLVSELMPVPTFRMRGSYLFTALKQLIVKQTIF